MRHRDDGSLALRNRIEPPCRAVHDVARTFSARWPEIQASMLVARELAAEAGAQLGETETFPRTPVHLGQRGLDARRMTA